MNVFRWLPIVAFVSLAACGGTEKDVVDSPQTVVSASDVTVSGRVEEGLRVLTFDPAGPSERFTIYRGDYVRPEFVGDGPFMLEILDLEVAMQVPVPEGERGYFKVPDAGTFAVRIGKWTGEIEAVEYASSHYREVGSQEALSLIGEVDPLVLDVRRPAEYEAGHLENATLIPVQELANRLGELSDAKSRPILVYCRSGNRSTVAAKMLVEAGFSDVINMRQGFVAWEKEGLPVAR